VGIGFGARRLLEIAFDLSKNFEEIAELGQRYRDRTPDLADLCLIRMSDSMAIFRAYGG